MARDALTVRQRALNCLARREYTRDELYRKLLPYTEESDSLEDLLADFKARGWLSEQRFVEQVVHARSGRYGSRYIAHELREKGVAEELIEQALPQMQENDLETARMIWTKKFGKMPEDAKERAKQTRFLQGRGFSFPVIAKVLENGGDS
ncbi:MAG: recombination regulator RecX [Sulfuricella sp.]|nr:recombination regulator RecX [Sulfuricella sp.]